MATRRKTQAGGSSNAEPTMRDELRALKIDRILQMASKLFIEHGFVGTTMEAIADEMGMTKPFIYQFFQNKHALLAAICDRELRGSLAMLNEPATKQGTPDERLANFIRVATRRNIENRGLWSLMSSEEKHLPKEMLSAIRALEVQFHKRLTAIIEDGVAAGVFEASHVEVTSRAVMGMTQWVRRWYRPSSEMDGEAVADEFCELAMRMVAFKPRASARANAR